MTWVSGGRSWALLPHWHAHGMSSGEWQTFLLFPQQLNNGDALNIFKAHLAWKCRNPSPKPACGAFTVAALACLCGTGARLFSEPSRACLACCRALRGWESDVHMFKVEAICEDHLDLPEALGLWEHPDKWQMVLISVRAAVAHSMWSPPLEMAQACGCGRTDSV